LWFPGSQLHASPLHEFSAQGINFVDGAIDEPGKRRHRLFSSKPAQERKPMMNVARILAAGMAAAVLVAHGSAAAGQAGPAPAPAPGSGGVNVTVKYTGKGVVDKSHMLWVWLFDTPDIGPGAIPIAEQSIDTNGGTVSFSGVTSKEVYVAVAYDEGGGFTGQAPPPPGSPIALYGVKADTDKPQPVAPGPKASVAIAFNDAQRMQ
jgi:hypothetical protein